MKLLIVADLHLRADLASDYRWKIFKWLDKQKWDSLVILGDLTDEKDKHPAELVTNLTYKLRDLTRIGPVHIVMGNHDYVDPFCPYFGFLDLFQPNINFYSQSTVVKLKGGLRCLFVPHSREPDWRGILEDSVEGRIDILFLHQMFEGSITPSGHRLHGPNAKMFRKFKGLIFSGDIHMPQEVGPVTYVGSPYPICFGDEFQPRAILIDTDKPKETRVTSINLETIRKLILEVRGLEGVKGIWKGDHVRVRVSLSRESYSDWPVISKEIQSEVVKQGGILKGVELVARERKRLRGTTVARPNSHQIPKSLYDSYCKLVSVEDESLREVGGSFLDDSEGED